MDKDEELSESELNIRKYYENEIKRIKQNLKEMDERIEGYKEEISRNEKEGASVLD